MKVTIDERSYFNECGILEIPHSIHNSVQYSDQGPFIFKPVDQPETEYLPLIKVHSEFYGTYGLCDILNGKYIGQEWLHDNRLYKVYETKIIRSKPPTNSSVPIYAYIDKSDERVFVGELNPGFAFTVNERMLHGRIFMKIHSVAGKSQSTGYALFEHYNAISLVDGVLCYVPTDMLVETVGYELVTV